MQFSIISLAFAFSSLVSAQSIYAHLPDLPLAVAQDGLIDAVYESASQCVRNCLTLQTKLAWLRCPITDIGCRCVIPAYNDLWASCVANKCHGGEVVDIDNAVKDACKVAGVKRTAEEAYPLPYFAPHYFNLDANVKELFETAKTRTQPLISR